VVTPLRGQQARKIEFAEMEITEIVFAVDATV